MFCCWHQVLTVQDILQVHVGWLEGGTAILAFRGTQTAQDGLQDVKIVRQSIDHLQKMFPGTQAHSGKLFNHMHGFGMSAEVCHLFGMSGQHATCLACLQHAPLHVFACNSICPGVWMEDLV